MTEGKFEPCSIMFVPADSERFVMSAHTRGADVICLDLEDSIAPSAKAAARTALARGVAHLHAHGCVALVRINHDPALLAADVAASVSSGADGVVLPKAEAPEQLARLAADLALEEQRCSRSSTRLLMMGIIETPKGLVRAADIAQSTPRLAALGFGADDFATAMGIAPLQEAMTHPVQAMAIAAASAGLHAVGLPGSVGGFSDMPAFRNLAVAARTLGLGGSFCIHPAQVPVLNEVFGGTDAERAEAAEIVAAFDIALAQGKASIALHGRMIDIPVASRARRLLGRRKGAVKD